MTDERLLTGHAALDALTDGGFPRSRMTEIVGSASSGKTALIMKTVESTLDAGGKVLVVDFDRVWTVLRPTSWLEPWRAMGHVLKGGNTDLVVIDCLAKGMPGVRENFGPPEIYTSESGLLLSALLPRVSVFLRKYSPRTALVFLARSDGDWQPGGKAIKFYPHLRLRLAREEGETRALVIKTNIGVQQGGEAVLP
jgi:KaiC/GvpD/RAD55 family RecA-like ATPase